MDPNMFRDLPLFLSICACLIAIIAFGLGAWIF